MAEFRGFHSKNNYQQHNNSARPPALIADRLGKLLGMTGSAHDAEALAAARKANELLRSHNLTWFDVVLPFAESTANPLRESGDWAEPMGWEAAVAFCDRYRFRLTERDATFIAILTGYTDQPSQKQLAWLQDIVGKLLAMGIVP